jgi:D-lactate dehydrogenase
VVGSLGLDVYEEEADLFFEDLSNRFIDDDVFARLLTFPNVLITGHQAFFTREALGAIARTTIANVTAFERTGRATHEVSVDKVKG